MAYDALLNYVEDDKEDYDTVDEWREDRHTWEKELNLLKQAAGFTIYLQRKKNIYEKLINK